MDSNGVLDAGVMYPAYRTWLVNNMNSLPAHDHAMLFSGFVLTLPITNLGSDHTERQHQY